MSVYGGAMSYKRCTTCGHEWKTRESFLGDPLVLVVGYQASFKDLAVGCFLFNHHVPGCNTTMAIATGEFFDLYEGPVFEGRRRGTGECPDYCMNKSDLRVCPVRCECAFVREVLQVVLNWPKLS